MKMADLSAPWAWMAGAFQVVGACSVTDISAVASLQRSDKRFHW